MAATDHTRLRTARLAARKNSDGRHRDAVRYGRVVLLNPDLVLRRQAVGQASGLIRGEP